MDFSGTGSEQGGIRPGIVFQNNIGNLYSPNIIAIPLTTSFKKLGQPTHVVLPAAETGLLKDSVAICENPERMSKNRIKKYLTTLSPKHMRNVAIASLLATSAVSYLSVETLLETWQKALRLNTADATVV